LKKEALELKKGKACRDRNSETIASIQIRKDDFFFTIARGRAMIGAAIHT
jgi:hypothetical protein